jgi:hypothetical protein
VECPKDQVSIDRAIRWPNEVGFEGSLPVELEGAVVAATGEGAQLRSGWAKCRCLYDWYQTTNCRFSRERSMKER